VIAGVVVSVGAVLGGGTLLLVLLLKRRKNKQKTAELTDVKVLTTDNDDGKYISLPSAVAIHNYAIPKQKIQLKQQIASGTNFDMLRYSLTRVNMLTEPFKKVLLSAIRYDRFVRCSLRSSVQQHTCRRESSSKQHVVHGRFSQ
jgi:hypothetical protein